MHERNVSIALVLAMLFVCRAGADTADCPAPALRDAREASALIARIAKAEPDALARTPAALACFGANDLERFAAASGEYFDARPREHLQLARTDGYRMLLEWIAIPPARLNGNAAAQIELLKRRAVVYDTHRNLLLDPAEKVGVVNSFSRQVERRIEKLAAGLSEPAALPHPLFGIEMGPLNRPQVPAPINYLSVVDQVRGNGWRIFAQQRDAHVSHVMYVLISGHAYRYDRDDPTRPVGFAPDPGWIVKIDERELRTVVDVIGPASSLFTNEKLPRFVRDGLRDGALYNLIHAFRDTQELQRAFDERIAKHPDAVLAQPLRDALTRKNIDVRRYRGTPPQPPVTARTGTPRL